MDDYNKSVANFKREILFLSSSKAKEFADKVRQQLNDRILNDNRLRDEYECIAWDNRRIFKKSYSTFASLLEYAKFLCDTGGYAVCVLYPDDLLIKDGDENSILYYVPRDNVIFELGLFYGVLGQNNTFFLFCDSANNKIVHKPSDLEGVTEFRYQWNLTANAPNEDAPKILAVEIFDTISDMINKNMYQNDVEKSTVEEAVTKVMSTIRNDTIEDGTIDNSHHTKIISADLSTCDTYFYNPHNVSKSKDSENNKPINRFPKPLNRGI